MSDHTFRMPNPDGSISETLLTERQAKALAHGHPIAYWARDEQILVEDDGTIIHREDARPERPADS